MHSQEVQLNPVGVTGRTEAVLVFDVRTFTRGAVGVASRRHAEAAFAQLRADLGWAYDSKGIVPSVANRDTVALRRMGAAGRAAAVVVFAPGSADDVRRVVPASAGNVRDKRAMIALRADGLVLPAISSEKLAITVETST